MSFGFSRRRRGGDLEGRADLLDPHPRRGGGGRVEDAREMLGRPFELEGVIARGDRMGKRLGWPTINLAPANELLPGGRGLRRAGFISRASRRPSTA